MDEVVITSDSEELLKKYDAAVRALDEAVVVSIQDVQSKVLTAARANLLSAYPATASTQQYRKPLVQEVRKTKVWEKDYQTKGMVRADDTRDRGSGSYVLRFLEGGTVQRRTKKGYNRGKVTGCSFFSRAVDSVAGAIKQIFEAAMEKSVQKFNEA